MWTIKHEQTNSGYNGKEYKELTLSDKDGQTFSARVYDEGDWLDSLVAGVQVEGYLRQMTGYNLFIDLKEYRAYHDLKKLECYDGEGVYYEVQMVVINQRTGKRIECKKQTHIPAMNNEMLSDLSKTINLDLVI